MVCRAKTTPKFVTIFIDLSAKIIILSTCMFMHADR